MVVFLLPLFLLTLILNTGEINKLEWEITSKIRQAIVLLIVIKTTKTYSPSFFQEL